MVLTEQDIFVIWGQIELVSDLEIKNLGYWEKLLQSVAIFQKVQILEKFVYRKLFVHQRTFGAKKSEFGLLA